MRDWQAFVRTRLELTGIRRAREDRLVGEVAAQLEDLYRDALARGATDEEADRIARAHVADWPKLAADLVAADRTAREPRIEQHLQEAVERRSPFRPAWRALAAMRQDLGYAARLLARRPGVASVLVLTLALGIGANSAIFGAVDAVLFRPLPYARPDRLVNLFEDNLAHGDTHFEISVPNWNDWRLQAHVFEGSAAYVYRQATLTGDTDARRLESVSTSVGTFGLLGIVPALGRDFVPDDASTGRDVVILSHSLWQELFGGDPGAIGRAVRLDGRPHTIVGVMPASFGFPSRDIDCWRPLPADPSQVGGGRGRHFAYAIARLKAGVTLEQARSDLNRVAAGLAAAYPETNAGWTVGVEPLQESIVGESRVSLLLAWAAAALVLLTACSNAAGILATEAAAREREIAVRTALGAGRRRIAAQMLTEALFVASISGVLGAGLAALGVRALSRLVAGTVPLADRIALDWRVVAFTALSVAGVSVLAGMIPAFKASAVALPAALKEAGRMTMTGGRRSLRHLLVAAQVATAFVLLVSAALIGRSIVNLWRAPTGFDPRGVLTFTYSLPITADTTREAIVATHGQVISRLASVPGVQAAGLALVLPLEGDVEVRALGIDGRPASEMANAEVMARPVSADFVGTLRIRLLQGRPLTAFDRAGREQVALISRAAAARYWPSENPLGSHIRVAGQRWTVVGVIEDVPTGGLDAAPKPVVYMPIDQWPARMPSMTAAVRTDGEPAAVMSGIRRAVAEVNREVPVFAVRTLEDLCGDSTARHRVGALIIGLFALVALVLAIVGIYGTVSHLVIQRTHEIGIRMAVGAGPWTILRATVGEGVLLAAGGLAAGVFGAAASARLLRSLLFGVSGTDPLTYVVISIVLLGVVIAASWVPARRAAHIDPVAAIRSE